MQCETDLQHNLPGKQQITEKHFIFNEQRNKNSIQSKRVVSEPNHNHNSKSYHHIISYIIYHIQLLMQKLTVHVSICERKCYRAKQYF